MVVGMDVLVMVAELLGVDAGGCDRGGLERAVGLVRQVEAWLAVVSAGLTRRGEELHRAGAGREVGEVWQRAGGLSRRDAREAVARAETLARSPVFAVALASGAISPGHVDAYGAAVRQAPVLAGRAEELAVAASRTTPAEFERHCQRVALVATSEVDADERFRQQQRATRARRWIDKTTGMYRLSGELDPETGEKMWTAIDRHLEARFHGAPPPATAPDDPRDRQDHLCALALADLVVNTDSTPGHGTRRSEMNVLIDLDTLLHGLHDRSIVDLGYGGTVAVSVIRRMACDADIIPIVLSGDGVVLDVGRSKRLATAAQRRALRAMYPTCMIPGCTVVFERTQSHHLDPWATGGGRTDLGSQGPLCNGHHDDTHSGRIILQLDPVTRALTVRARDGTILARTTGPPGRRAQPS